MNLWKVIDGFLTKKVHLIDVGGYKGEFSDNINSFVKNIERIDIFEPQYNSFLELNKKYSLQHNIHIHNIALGKEQGKKDFFYFDEQGYKSSLLKPLESGSKVTEVEVQMIDRLYGDADVQIDYILKLDTQGNDLEVLKGSTEFLLQAKPLVFCELIFVNLYEKQAYAHEIIDFLRLHNYSLVRMEDLHETKNGILAYADALFVHENALNPDCTSFELHKDSYCLNLENVCEERLELINRLDSECRRLSK